MQKLVELFFPARCVCCDMRIVEAVNPYICLECRGKIELLVIKQRCVCCGTPLPWMARTADEKQHLCGGCLQNPPSYSVARSLFLHREPIKTLIHDLKYHRTSAALTAIQTLVPSIREEFVDCDVIIPVPLHTKKLRERGFNQSLLLAKIIFSDTSSKIRSDLLKRVRNTPPQTTMSGKQRRRNLRKAFSVNQNTDLTGKVICLVDDVFTTGSTVNECSLILKSCGAKDVKVFTLSRSPLK